MRYTATILALCLAATPALAIDCSSQKQTAVEAVLCNDEIAASADKDLNDLYWRTLAGLKGRVVWRHDWLIVDQREWLAHREDLCKPLTGQVRTDCVVNATNDRIGDLKAGFPPVVKNATE